MKLICVYLIRSMIWRDPWEIDMRKRLARMLKCFWTKTWLKVSVTCCCFTLFYADQLYLFSNHIVISKTPLYMRVDTKYNLSDSLFNDTQFLLSLDVMDYSLLVGFDEDTNEIVVGIVGKLSQIKIKRGKDVKLTFSSE